MDDQKESHTIDRDNKPGEERVAQQRNPAGQKTGKIALWSVIACAVLAGVWWIMSPSAQVSIIKPQRGIVLEEVFGTGTLESKVVVNVSAKMIGKVIEVLVDQGDTVTAGQTMARLESNDYDDAVRAAEANLGQAQAELARARIDVDRYGGLAGKKAASQADVDTAETGFKVAEAHVKNAEGQLGVARARVSDAQILSPIAGLVIARNLETGSTVVPGTPIFRVIDTQLLWIQAMVDESVAGKLAVGQPARVFFRNMPGEPQAGRLARLSLEADRVTEERQIEVALERMPVGFFIGAKADVLVETARRENALQIPKSALVKRGSKAGVLVVSGGRARWKEIQVGMIGRDTIEITSGITEKDRIVAVPFVGKRMVADGQRVRAEKAR
jgi:HlyD family secretion protein